MDPISQQLIGAGGRVGLGQVVYSTPGTYTFVVPSEVFFISAVAIGGGGGGGVAASSIEAAGGGGGLAYKNSISVTPGQSITVIVGAGGNASGIFTAPGSGPFPNPSPLSGNGSPSGIQIDASWVLQAGGGFAGSQGRSGGSVIVGDGGGSGGAGGNLNRSAGGGGAGGYSGSGGAGSSTFGSNGASGSGGGSGGGGAGDTFSSASLFGERAGGRGGNTGVQGAGSNGAGGLGGSTGSPGGNGSPIGTVFAGGGGNSGQIIYFVSTDTYIFSASASGNPGAVRIIWGAGRAFPSTNTGDV